jgi:hypothetical protein
VERDRGSVDTLYRDIGKRIAQWETIPNGFSSALRPTSPQRHA